MVGKRNNSVRKADAGRRYRQLRDMSAAGETKAGAAQRLGITVGGVNTILYRYDRSTKWPMKQ